MNENESATAVDLAATVRNEARIARADGPGYLNCWPIRAGRKDRERCHHSLIGMYSTRRARSGPAGD